MKKKELWHSGTGRFPEFPSSFFEASGRWRTLGEVGGMSAITFRVHRKSGDYVKATVVPANHSEEPRFGWLDGAIVTFFLLCVGGLVYLLSVS